MITSIWRAHKDKRVSTDSESVKNNWLSKYYMHSPGKQIVREKNSQGTLHNYKELESTEEERVMY